MKNQKHYDIETLRGIAVILMVAGHVIGITSDSGMKVSNDSGWRYAYDFLAPFRMPLFTVISGFVYSLRPVSFSTYKVFMKGKVRRIMLPLVFVSSCFIGLQLFIPGVNTNLSSASIADFTIYPYAHFWFLYAVMWIFATIVLFEHFNFLSTPPRLLLCLISAVLLWFWNPLDTYFLGIGSAVYLFPYFILGIGLQRHGDYLRKPAIKIVGWILACAAYTVYQLSYMKIFSPSEDMHRIVVLTCGVSTTYLAMQYRKTFIPLAKIGAYSYGIYLWHLLGTAGARVVMNRMGLTSLTVIFVMGEMAGLFFPIVLEKTADKWYWLRLLWFGRSKTLVLPGASKTRNETFVKERA